MSYFLEGYTDQLSYQTGEEVRFHLNTNSPSYSLEIRCLGTDPNVLYRAENLSGATFPTPENASSVGCGWPAAKAKVIVPATWRSGVYGVFTRLADNSDGDSIRFIVRSPNPGRDARILLQLTTNTYHAYNNWGGYSFYPPPMSAGQVTRLSFDRPDSWWLFDLWEWRFICWAERSGYSIHYAVNSDLEFHPEILEHYQLVLSVGHDEYWSSPMRDHLEAYISSGGNVAFFSGNTCCWQVRTCDNGRALVCWKEQYSEDPFYHADQPDHPDHRFLTALWGHPWIKRPENRLIGVGTASGGYTIPGQRVFTVHRPDHWVFAGTGLTSGDTFGRDHIDPKHRIVGYECDGCDFEEIDGLPVPTHLDGTPDNFTILARAPAAWTTNWDHYPEPNRPRATGGSAMLGLYSNNGMVFTAGTIGWANGLHDGDAVVERITRNVLDRLASTPRNRVVTLIS